jgi:hypothetical protein
LPTFLIKNEYDVPIRVKCLNIFLDDLAECKMGKEIRLRDNEKYNIHYSLNIYNKSEEINETAIGEFRYEDTKINDNKYYIIKLFDFKRGVIQLITLDKVEKGKYLYGLSAPNMIMWLKFINFILHVMELIKIILDAKLKKILIR